MDAQNSSAHSSSSHTKNSAKHWRHPEQAYDETWVGNIHPKDFREGEGWKSKRQGTVPYDRDTREPIVGSEEKPVFVKTSEMNEAERRLS